MARTRFILGIFACTAALTALAVDPVKLEWKPKVGDYHYYKFEMSITAPSDSDSGTMRVSAELKQTVHAIDKDGTITMDRRWSKFAASMNGAEGGDDGKPPDFTTRDTFTSLGGLVDEQQLNDDGTVKVKKEAKSDGDGDDDANNEFSPPVPQVFFPKKPVEIGATWPDESSVRDATGKASAKKKDAAKDQDPTDALAGQILYTFVGEDKIGDKDCYRIDVSTKPMKDSDGSVYGHIWIAKDDGTLVQSDVKLHGIKPAEDQPAINIDITATLDD